MTFAKLPEDFSKPSGDIKKIVFFCFQDGDPLSHLRVLGAARQLGIQVVKGIEKGEIFIERVYEGDLVVMLRDFPRYTAVYEKILKLAHNLGKPVILDIDDLLFELPNTHPDRLSNAYLDALFPLFQALTEVDLVTVSTPALSKFFLPYNKNIAIVPNYLDDHIWHLTPPKNSSSKVNDGKQVIIGYMGTYTHLPDLNYLLPVLFGLLDRYPKNLQLHFWGVRPPEELEERPNVRWHSMNTRTYADFAKFFQTQAVDIFIAPLQENSFNICKSSIKYLEYTSLGVPGVYSNLEPYSNVIRHGETGFLASSLGEWETCLIELIEDRNLRHTIATNAQKDVETNWLLSKNASKLSDAYKKAMAIENFTYLDKEKALYLRIFKSITQQLDETLHKENPQIKLLTDELAEIKSSKAWKIILLFRRIRSITSRFRILKIKYRSLKSYSYFSLLKRSDFFDATWYLSNNPDVDNLEMDPLHHYLFFGGFEGRDPSPHFSSRWYLDKYKDVQVSGQNPLVHYLQFGKAEGRSPKPDTKNEGRLPKQDTKNELGLIDCAQFFGATTQDEHLAEKYKTAIDIIVPVYNGMDFLPALFESLYSNTDERFRLIVVDDNSTDSRVKPFLNNLAEQHENFNLLFNSDNKGFVKTINLASAYVHNHFVILNTDVQVPKGWLNRLMKPILDQPDIASTTPFTNSGTICSFPKVLVDNPLFDGLSVDDVDNAFKQVDANSITIELPTGVGFCMGINLDAWKRIGCFDEKLFGKGYGEENDWCRRAISSGYRNLMVTNLFIYHNSGGSFDSKEKQKLLEENSGKLIKLYPDYLARVQEFIDADLPKPIRKFASLILISASSSKKPILIVDHQVGGSANFYRKQMVQDCINSGQAVLLLTFDAERQEMNLQALYKEYSEIFKIWKPEDLSILAKYIELSEICLNNLVTYPDPLSVIEVILQLKHIFNSRLKILFHDHYALCPSYTLLDHNGIYCNLPIENICNICLPKNDYRIPNNLHNEINISKWRKVWSNLLSNADEIICFSKSSQILLQRIYNLKNELVSIQPHKFISPFSKKPKLDFNMPLCIGVVGGINYQKGSQMVLDVAKIIAIKHPEIKIVIIGSLEIANKLPNLILAGPYQPSELPDLIEKYQINLCFFSSIIPETFSYVTSELIELEVPICAFDIGAQAERVGEYKFGHIISKIDAETALSEMIAYYSQLKK